MVEGARGAHMHHNCVHAKLFVLPWSWGGVGDSYPPPPHIGQNFCEEMFPQRFADFGMILVWLVVLGVVHRQFFL